MSRSPEDYLQHILDEAEYLFQSSQNLSKEDFLKDETLKRAYIRSLEVIGEATKNLPNSFKAEHPEVAWRRMAGMRDKLIHNYFGVDYDIVWNAIIDEIPNLKVKIENILKEIKGE
ncbi:HepT-like ribonuclease domain-containing protein [Dactylococcopsis salina]|uniref:Nucleotidyltransferase n=1 Tax=Dactylococcopsis salina (strain PCC 8305) TaxID=13035 RepID=K9YPQ7_DACS8|nr:DUF86 domain-containing protein [Dactylococcopsis salina]AFZ48916.1 hypothetical protein Dacsa_0098 [Dactylococcopsis salina PCC 8305]